LAFTTTTGAGGTSLIGTSGVDTASVAGNLFPLFVGAQAANDVITLSNTTTSVTAYLGAGSDTFTAGALGSSTIQGNDGNDLITLTGALTSSALVNGNAGSDTVTFSTGSLASGAKVLGGAGNDTFTIGTITLASGTAINGNDGDDTFSIGLGTAMSGATIFGGQGNDTINAADGTAGAILSGDNDNDTITGSLLAADTLFGGAGNDTLVGGAFDGVSYVSVDSLIGGSGVDTFDGLGAFGSATQSVTATTAITTFDVITDFTVGTDLLKVGAVSFGGTYQGTGTMATAGSYYAISGTYSSGSFTVKAIADGGFDTLVASNVAAAGTTVNLRGLESAVLVGVLANSFNSSIFTA